MPPDRFGKREIEAAARDTDRGLRGQTLRLAPRREIFVTFDRADLQKIVQASLRDGAHISAVGDEAARLRVQFKQQAKIAIARKGLGEATLRAAGVTQCDPPVPARDEIAVHEGQFGEAELVQAMGKIQPAQGMLSRMWVELPKCRSHGVNSIEGWCCIDRQGIRPAPGPVMAQMQKTQADCAWDGDPVC